MGRNTRLETPMVACQEDTLMLTPMVSFKELNMLLMVLGSVSLTPDSQWLQNSTPSPLLLPFSTPSPLLHQSSMALPQNQSRTLPRLPKLELLTWLLLKLPRPRLLRDGDVMPTQLFLVEHPESSLPQLLLFTTLQSVQSLLHQLLLLDTMDMVDTHLLSKHLAIFKKIMQPW